MKEGFLDRVRQQMAKLQSKGLYWRPTTGPNRIRILPRPGFGHEEFFYEIGQHTGMTVEERRVPLTCFRTMGHDECPYCDFANFLQAQDDKTDRSLGTKISVRSKYFFNLIDRRYPTQVKVFGFGKEKIGELLAVFEDPDIGDFISAKHGNDVVVTKTGQALGTRYSVRVRERRTKLSLPGWKSKLHNLEHEITRRISIEEALDILEENFGADYEMEGILGQYYETDSKKSKRKTK